MSVMLFNKMGPDIIVIFIAIPISIVALNPTVIAFLNITVIPTIILILTIILIPMVFISVPVNPIITVAGTS